MALLVSDVRTAFERRKRDITDVPTSTFNEWCDFVNRFTYRKLSETDPGRYVKTQTINISSAPQTVALPSDFESIRPLGTGFFFVDDDGTQTERRLARTGFGSERIGYYIQGTNVIITGIDDTQTFTLRYLPLSTKIDDSTDYFTVDTTVSGVETIPDEYLDYLIQAIDVRYTQWDEDPTSESLSDFRFIRALDDLLSHIRKEPSAYGLPDFTIMF